nr:uncharacterized protein LOC107447041 [Parasteatoda tepidariorum]
MKLSMLLATLVKMGLHRFYFSLNLIYLLLIFVSTFKNYDARVPDLYEMYGLSEYDYPVLYYFLLPEDGLPEGYRKVPCECEDDESEERRKRVDYLIDLYNEYIEDGKLNGSLIHSVKSSEMDSTIHNVPVVIESRKNPSNRLKRPVEILPIKTPGMKKMIFNRPIEIESLNSSERYKRPVIIHECPLSFDIIEGLLNGTYRMVPIKSSGTKKYLFKRPVEIENIPTKDKYGKTGKRPVVIHESPFTFEIIKSILNGTYRMLNNKTSGDMTKFFERPIEIIKSGKMNKRPFTIPKSPLTFEILESILNGTYKMVSNMTNQMMNFLFKRPVEIEPGKYGKRPVIIHEDQLTFEILEKLLSKCPNCPFNTTYEMMKTLFNRSVEIESLPGKYGKRPVIIHKSPLTFEVLQGLLNGTYKMIFDTSDISMEKPGKRPIVMNEGPFTFEIIKMILNGTYQRLTNATAGDMTSLYKRPFEIMKYNSSGKMNKTPVYTQESPLTFEILEGLLNSTYRMVPNMTSEMMDFIFNHPIEIEPGKYVRPGIVYKDPLTFKVLESFNICPDCLFNTTSGVMEILNICPNCLFNSTSEMMNTIYNRAIEIESSSEKYGKRPVVIHKSPLTFEVIQGLLNGTYRMIFSTKDIRYEKPRKRPVDIRKNPFTFEIIKMVLNGTYQLPSDTESEIIELILNGTYRMQTDITLDRFDPTGKQPVVIPENPLTFEIIKLILNGTYQMITNATSEDMTLLFKRPIEISKLNSSGEITKQPVIIHESPLTFEILEGLLNGTYRIVTNKTAEVMSVLFKRPIEIDPGMYGKRPIIIRKDPSTFEILQSLNICPNCLFNTTSDFLQSVNICPNCLPNASSDFLQSLKICPNCQSNTTSGRFGKRPVVIHKSPLTLEVLQGLLNGTYVMIFNTNEIKINTMKEQLLANITKAMNLQIEELNNLTRTGTDIDRLLAIISKAKGKKKTEEWLAFFLKAMQLQNEDTKIQINNDEEREKLFVNITQGKYLFMHSNFF